MKDDQIFISLLEEGTDPHILCDMLSISIDGCSANTDLYKRVTNRFEKAVFQRISFLYWKLSQRLLVCLECLPVDTGTMNPEAGYIAKAYLTATRSSVEKAPNRVMRINKQALNRIRKLVAKLNDRQYAISVNQYLESIQTTLDNRQYQLTQGKLGRSVMLTETV